MAVGALPVVVAVVAWIALPESPRWLAAKGRLAEADRLVGRMEAVATRTGEALPPLDHVLPAPVAARTRLAEMFKPPYTGRTALLAVLWFATFFVTYGFSTWMPTLYVSVGGLAPSSSLLLTVVLGAVQVAMAVVVASIVEKMSRRTVFRVGFAIAAAGALFGFVNLTVLHQTTWQVLFTVAVVMTIGIMLPTMTLYLYTSELYPTRMRGFASSSTSSLSRVASIVSPSVFGFLLDGHGGAGIVFAVLAGIAAVGFITMLVSGVETRGKSLEELSA
jgi:putative MFS transporter